VTVKYEYTDGLGTKLIADLPAGQTDQTTTYIYGTVAGTPSASKVAIGPPPSGRALPRHDEHGHGPHRHQLRLQRRRELAYNVQGQETTARTRAATSSRPTSTAGRHDAEARTPPGLGLSTGPCVGSHRLRWSRPHLDRDPARQRDVGSGSVVDEVKYTYDDWGNIEKFEQDRDSAVGAYGSVNDYEVSYTYETKTPAGTPCGGPG
jgi:hypothetical protein